MYGYPEQFIPASELVGSGLPGSPSHASVVLSTQSNRTRRSPSVRWPKEARTMKKIEAFIRHEAFDVDPQGTARRRHPEPVDH